MNREELLLTSKELEKLQEYQEPNNESIGYERNIAKAQLDKVLNWILGLDGGVLVDVGTWVKAPSFAKFLKDIVPDPPKELEHKTTLPPPRANRIYK